jgi:hypothetical protein
VDHSFNAGKDKIYGRYIFENQADDSGATSGGVNQQGLGRVMRGMKGGFDGRFSNTNLGHTKVFSRAVNDARFAFQTIFTNRGNDDAVVPQITATGFTAGWAIFNSATKIRADSRRADAESRPARARWREFQRLFKAIHRGS